MKPRLLLLTNRLIVGGISNDIIPLAYYLQPYFDILILYGEKAKDEIEADFLLARYPGLNIKKIANFKKNNNPFNDFTAYSQIKQLMKDFKPDIVHTHGAKSGFLGRIAAHKNKVPCIVHTYHGHHFHSYYKKFINSFLLKIERRLGSFTNVVIAISKWQEKELVEIYKIVPANKIKIIPLGIEEQKANTDTVEQRLFFRKKYNIKDDTVAIGVVGRIVPVKNLKLFIEVAAKLIASKTKEIRFFIIGDGVLRKEIEKQCKSLNLSYTENAGEDANIIFTSWIEDILPAMHAMDIVALTSNNEGTPMSLIEAQFSGKPVVATNVGGVRDIVINNETGFLTEPGNAEIMCEKLKLLIEQRELRNMMGKKAADFARANFSKQKEIESYKQLYKSLVSIEKAEVSYIHQKI